MNLYKQKQKADLAIGNFNSNGRPDLVTVSEITKVTLTLSLLTATLLLTRPAEAVVRFSRTGDDLLVDIQAPITLVATENRSTATYGIVFENVYGVSVTSTARVTPPVLTSTMTIGASANTRYGIWGHEAFPQGVIDDSDFLARLTFCNLREFESSACIQRVAS